MSEPTRIAPVDSSDAAHPFARVLEPIAHEHAVPARDTSPEGRAIMSRREMFNHATAVPLAASLAIAAGVAPAPSNFSRLLEIERELQRFAAEIEATFLPNVAAFRRWNEMRKPWQVPYPPGRWSTPRDHYRYGQTKARWDRRLAQARIDAGLAATEGRIADLRSERDDLVASVWSVPATDLATLQVKARMAEMHSNILGSLAADVRVLPSSMALA